MATTWMKTIHIGKNGSIASVLENRTEYATNPEKTAGGELIAAYECEPFTVQSEFLFSKKLYLQKTGREQGEHNVLAYHIRQSFKHDEVTAEEALRIGYDLAMRFTKGRHQFIVAAHTNTKNPHTHIIFNSVNLESNGKFKDFKYSAIALRRLSDQICLENGLSIIEKPKPSKGWNRAKYLGEVKAPTVRGKLRKLIDDNIIVGRVLTDFFTALKKAGVEIKSGKQFSFKIPGGTKFTRQDTLGGDYTMEAILERLSGKRVIEVKEKNIAPVVLNHKPNLLIDIQAKIREGKGAGYGQWSRIFNLKESARTLLFLKDNGINSYDELVQKSAAVSAEFNERLNKIKAVDKRLGEISELQKYIGTYGKTRDVYRQYLSAKNREDFFEEHRADITLHIAAKKYFDSLGYGKNNKLPTIAALKQGYATLLAEKKKLYVGYHELKEKRATLLTAKMNSDNILGINKNARNRNDLHTSKHNNFYER